MNKEKTLITAHSGCENTLPNSREHIKAAIASGAEMIEIDVRKDGDLLYLSHDVSDAPETCVSLDEFLDMIEPCENMRINFDVKTENLAALVMEKVNLRNMSERAVFTGMCNEEKEIIEGLGGELWISLWPSHNNEADIMRAEKFCMEKELSLINLHYSMITKKDHERLKSKNLDFSAWTVDEEEEIVKLLEMGIFNITTRKPCLALKLRGEIQGK